MLKSGPELVHRVVSSQIMMRSGVQIFRRSRFVLQQE